jgi:hypothetical protein
MRTFSGYKIFVLFICVSMFALTGGFGRLAAEAQAMSRPVGEMVSRGDVSYQAGGNSWLKVQNTRVPVFGGMKIKTASGTAIISFANGSQVEAAGNTQFEIAESAVLHLIQGSIDFRISAGTEMNIAVGSLSILKCRPLQASKDPSVASKDEGVVGSVSLHSNGSVTVKSEQGLLSVLNPQRTVVATLASNDVLTIPAAVATGKESPTLSQAGDPKEGGGFLGLSTSALVGIGLAAGGIGALGVAAADSSGSDRRPACE